MKWAVVLFVILLFFPMNSFGLTHEIPDWVKNNAKWWSTSQISDTDFVKGLQYLLQKGTLHMLLRAQHMMLQSTSHHGLETMPTGGGMGFYLMKTLSRESNTL